MLATPDEQAYPTPAQPYLHPGQLVMDKKDPLKDVELLIKSRHGLIVIDTIEEERVELLLSHLADRMGIPLFTWTRTRGLRREGVATGVYGTNDGAQALGHIGAAQVNAIYHLQGFGSLLQNETIADRLKDVALQFGKRDGAIIMTGSLELPEAVRRLAAIVNLPGPATSDYKLLLEHILRDLSARMRVASQLTADDEQRLINNLRGLTLLEAEKVLTKAIVEDGKLTASDIQHVVDAKKQIVSREGVLEYYPLEESMSEVADLRGLKEWLSKRRAIIAEPDRAAEFGLTFPKGVLLVGVPGCGKSLCAKAIATEWNLPLLKLDPGALYNKYIGETEKNFRRAMQVAERISPVILWIDELEKAFASSTGSDDGGVSQRILGTFLSWMQDRTGDVFIVATANDVTRLPAEFLRKGRFDEIFFVDLPDAESREAIFRIHLMKRGKLPQRFDLTQLVAATDQFSGAEIEQVIVSALYTAFSAQGDLTTEGLLAETRATRPLATTMAERVRSIREWSRERTVRAN